MPSPSEEVRYQVFVSSTFSDLKEERERVLQAILECQAFPSGMELFPSADDEQFAFIRREIDSSDYYVVIIAGRYGSLAQDGISYTEKEFDYAYENKKPIFAFLVRDPSQIPLGKSESDQSLRERLARFREKAQRSRLVNYYENPDQLKGQVLHALNYHFRVNPQTGWVRANRSNREDLEEIRNLQGKVLELQAENAELRKARNTAKENLAQGSDRVSWLVDTSAIIAQKQEGAKSVKVSFSTGTDRFETSWDELLCALFWGARQHSLPPKCRRGSLDYLH